MIPDATVKKPEGWLDDEPDLVPDPSSEKPEDWYVTHDRYSLFLRSVVTAASAKHKLLRCHSFTCPRSAWKKKPKYKP